MNSANQKLALTGARIIDGNGAAPILDGVLLMGDRPSQDASGSMRNARPTRVCML